MDSILTSIKGMLGVTEAHTNFDNEIIAHINSVFADLTQMGVGPAEGFYIEDKSATWDEFVYDNLLLNSVKSYMQLRLKLLFDPGSIGSSTLASYERQIAQWEWRLNIAAETEEIDEYDSDDSTSSSGEGVTDYRKLSNLPKINGTTLIGNYDEKDPNVIEMSEDDVATMWNELFEET